MSKVRFGVGAVISKIFLWRCKSGSKVILTHTRRVWYNYTMITAIAAGVSAVVAALGLVGAINEPKAYGMAILILDVGILVDFTS